MEKVITLPLTEWENTQEEIKELKNIVSGKHLVKVRTRYGMHRDVIIEWYNGDEYIKEVARQFEELNLKNHALESENYILKAKAVAKPPKNNKIKWLTIGFIIGLWVEYLLTLI